jgi:cytochrome c553
MPNILDPLFVFLLAIQAAGDGRDPANCGKRVAEFEACARCHHNNRAATLALADRLIAYCPAPR